MSWKSKRKSNSRTRRADELSVARYVDGEFEGSDLAEVEMRLARDAEFREAVRLAKEQRRVIALAGEGPLPTAPAGFCAAVLERARCLPSRDVLSQYVEVEEMEAEVQRVGKYLLLAAALLFGLALLLGGNLLHSVDERSLDASPQEIQRLDEKVKQLKAADLARKNRPEAEDSGEPR